MTPSENTGYTLDYEKILSGTIQSIKLLGSSTMNLSGGEVTLNNGGAMGETCVLALLLGGLYLLARRVITWHAPVAFIGTVFLFALFVKGDAYVALQQILSGGLFLGAIFMATDYTTTPLSSLGRFIFGVGCGLITCVIRFWGSLPEGVSYAILLMNILTPWIERLATHKAFGGVKVK